MSQYVQHISGQGEKWELVSGVDPGDAWRVHAKHKPDEWHNCHWLPKSEYRLCDPPEQWVDVTENCRFQEGWNEIIFSPENRLGDIRLFGAKCAEGYRLRKVQLEKYVCEHGGGPNCSYNCHKTQWAFIVEKKQS